MKVTHEIRTGRREWGVRAKGTAPVWVSEKMYGGVSSLVDSLPSIFVLWGIGL
jgi:hypothetical protein